MKNKILAALLVIVTVLTGFCSCFGKVDDSGEVTVVIKNRDGSFTEYALELEDLENKDEGAVGVLEALAAREENPLPLDLQSGAYGKFINSIGALTPDATKGEYISVYTSVETDAGTSFSGLGEINYKDTVLKSSGVGVSSMQVPDGAIILFCIETYTG